MRQRASLRIRYHVFDGGNGQALAYARTLIDFLIVTRGKGYAFNYLVYIFGKLQTRRVARSLSIVLALDPSLLRRNGDTFFYRCRVVSSNFRSYTILQGRDDLAARRVVLRIRTEYDGDIQRQTDWVSLNLHVAFLHNIEEAHLNFAGQIRQFVNGKDSTVSARQQSVVHSEFTRE